MTQQPDFQIKSIIKTNKPPLPGLQSFVVQSQPVFSQSTRNLHHFKPPVFSSEDKENGTSAPSKEKTRNVVKKAQAEIYRTNKQKDKMKHSNSVKFNV